MSHGIASGAAFGEWMSVCLASALVFVFLQKSVGSFHVAFDDLPDAAFLLTSQGTILRWNEAAEDLIGSDTNLIGRDLGDVTSTDEELTIVQTLDQAVKDGYASKVTEFRTVYGTTLKCQVQVWLLPERHHGDGKLLALARPLNGSSVRPDPSSLDRQSTLGQMVELNPHLVAIVVNGTVAWINRSGANLLGATDFTQIVGRRWIDLAPPTDGFGEHRLRRVDGMVKEAEIVTAAIIHEGRAATLIHARDVSPAKLVERSLIRAEASLDLILDEVPYAILFLDEAGTIRRANHMAGILFGTVNDLLGRHLDKFLVDGDELMDDILTESAGAGTRQQIRIRRSDGGELPAALTFAERRVPAQRLIVAMFEDLSSQTAMLSQLAIGEKVLETTSEGVIVTDCDGVILSTNHAASKISGFTRDEMIGRFANFISGDLHTPAFYAGIQSALGSKGEWSGEVWNRRKDGEPYPEWLTVKSVTDIGGAPSRYVGVFSDTSRHKRVEETIRHLTYYDPVTRLPNRYLFQDRIAQALERARRNDRKVALVLVSLDRFKTVNETLGHQVGDALLREIAQRLTRSVRGEDTVSRLRGDTFCCVLNELTQSHDARPVINRILDCFNQSFLLEGHELFVTTSLGVSIFPLDASDMDDLLQKAETAMNRSKERAENTVHFYSPEMYANSMQRLQLETDLRKAVNRNELILHYQPKVETMTGRLVGAEALVRWRHPELGMISPASFIPIAEDSGLILPLGTQVVRNTCEQVRSWQEDGLVPVRVAVNLSAHQFRHPNLVDSFISILQDAHVPAELIELELTESAVMRNPDQAAATLGKLHDVGFGIAIDDFGTGYSSLGYLKKFPIDRLKIDRSFIMDLGTDQAAEEIVGAIIAMAHSLKMSVIAEGVETRHQLQMLRALACDEIQGYYFSRPIEADDFAQFLRTRILTGKEAAE